MKGKLIACEMIRDEVEKAIKETGYTGPVAWLEDSLHTHPEKLREALQKEVYGSEGEDISHLLFAYGYCGNAFIGLRSGSTPLVIPRVNDCTQLLLIDTFDQPHALGYYYLTRGWMEGKENPTWEYERMLKKRGEKVAKRVMEVMLAHYKALMLIDTGAYDLDQWRERAEYFSRIMGLELRQTKGTTRLLNQLLSGRWDEDFAIIPPNAEVTAEHFGDGDFSDQVQGCPLQT